MGYKTKERNQWTPADVAEAIKDGFYMKPQPRACRYCGFVAERMTDEDCPAKTKRYSFEGARTAGDTFAPLTANICLHK